MKHLTKNGTSYRLDVKVVGVLAVSGLPSMAIMEKPGSIKIDEKVVVPAQYCTT